MSDDDAIVRSYSQHAKEYDSAANLKSCWAPITEEAWREIRLGLAPHHRRVVEVGCGAGRALDRLAEGVPSTVSFIGVEPAEEMRSRAATTLEKHPHVEIKDGRFEELPLETDSVDYLFSILAFHWTTDLERSVRELSRVLKPNGEMDLFFPGRNTGREFTKVTTPVFLRYLGPVALLRSAGLRKQLSRDAAEELFQAHFPAERLVVTESEETYYDDLDGHWSWWVARTGGQFEKIPDEKRRTCDAEVRDAIASLATPRGIPYTVCLLRVRVRG